MYLAGSHEFFGSWLHHYVQWVFHWACRWLLSINETTSFLHLNDSEDLTYVKVERCRLSLSWNSPLGQLELHYCRCWEWFTYLSWRVDCQEVTARGLGLTKCYSTLMPGTAENLFDARERSGYTFLLNFSSYISIYWVRSLPLLYPMHLWLRLTLENFPLRSHIIYLRSHCPKIPQASVE